jgi:Protein of unknown function (DUF2939)
MVLVRAIDARDLNTVVQHINFDRVRVSLTEQMVTAYFRRSGTKPNPFAQQAVVAGASVLSPVVNKLVSPEAFSEFLAVGWPVAVAGSPPAGTLGINRETLGTAWQIFGSSQYGLGRFEVSAPIRHREESQISEPLASTAREDLSNSLHLIGRERILLPKLDAFVPSTPFGRPLFRHSFSLR